MANKDYKSFIEKYFSILDKDTQQPVPFKFRWTDSKGVEHSLQEKYYNILQTEYPNMEGIRDLILKARQEGISSLVLALFAVDFLLIPYSVSICISHRRDSTELLFKKVKFYIDSYCAKKGIDPPQLLKSDNKNLIENASNGASFYVGTAGAKVGGRGGSAKNVLFSEAAFYMDTQLITAQEMIVGTAQQVPQDHGMIFIESTANGEGNFYQAEWERSSRGESTYKPRFFGWQEFYTQEWVDEKKKEFPTEAMWKQEYPKDPDEAFITSGSPYFDNVILSEMLKSAPQPIQVGRIAPDGNFI